jgi:peroxiredoxin
MKKIIYLLFIAAVMAACTTTPKEPHYNITGKIAGADSVTFILQKREAGKYIKMDSAIVLKGEFKIKGGSVEYPIMVVLVAKDKRKSKQFFLENAEITLTGNLDSLYNVKVTGSKTQSELEALNNSIKVVDEIYSKTDQESADAKKAGDEKKVSEIKAKLDSLDKVMIQIEKDFVKNNPASYLTPTILSSLTYYMEPDEIENVVNSLDTNVAKVQIIKDLKARLQVLKTVAIGQKAPDFTLNDVTGKPIALSSKIGKSKLILIDFWASWCGPCRAENPNVVKVWKEFNKKGFDIFGVSLDKEGEMGNWLAAIKKDELTWTHVSDLKWWECAAAKLYAVRSIPANFLLDETGTIIAKNLRGDALKAKVKELLTVKK